MVQQLGVEPSLPIGDPHGTVGLEWSQNGAAVGGGAVTFHGFPPCYCGLRLVPEWCNSGGWSRHFPWGSPMLLWVEAGPRVVQQWGVESSLSMGFPHAAVG